MSINTLIKDYKDSTVIQDENNSVHADILYYPCTLRTKTAYVTKHLTAK